MIIEAFDDWEPEHIRSRIGKTESRVRVTRRGVMTHPLEDSGRVQTLTARSKQGERGGRLAWFNLESFEVTTRQLSSTIGEGLAGESCLQRIFRWTPGYSRSETAWTRNSSKLRLREVDVSPTPTRSDSHCRSLPKPRKCMAF